MTSPTSNDSHFLWVPQPRAWQYVENLVQQAIRPSDWLQRFRERLREETGTRLIDWLDHIVTPNSAALSDIGFHRTSPDIWQHPDGLFPKLLVDQHQRLPVLGLKVERVEAFLRILDVEDKSQVIGTPANIFRLATVDLGDTTLRVVERHGHQGFDSNASLEVSPDQLDALGDLFRDRPRDYDDPRTCFREALERFHRVAEAIGGDRACDLFFLSERRFWEQRNTAAGRQRERQNKLGLGWANHDHHTYRCSRTWFAPLVSMLEAMGFTCRERFYAGREAGWGAQVLEHSACGIVIFADVDMTDEEIKGDFAHQGLSGKGAFGTVGLWCQLHGDSFVSAGMHHLECQFDFDAARTQLAEQGIETMAPFTDFPYLRQAFTKGERWPVDRNRLQQLVASGAISQAEAETFAQRGAIGSHLEILERNDGYKGFNQTGISKIIQETNPTLELPEC